MGMNPSTTLAARNAGNPSSAAAIAWLAARRCDSPIASRRDCASARSSFLTAASVSVGAGLGATRLLDALVDLADPCLVHGPPFAAELCVELLDRLALLLDPGVVLQVVPLAAHVGRAVLHPIRALAVEDRNHAGVRLAFVHAAVGAGHVPHRRAVAIDGIGADGDDDVIGAEVEVLGSLDRAQHVAHAGDAEDGGQRLDLG